MIFRIKFTNNVNEYYRENSDDIQIHLTVEAGSFKAAEEKAEGLIGDLVIYSNEYDVVSIERIDDTDRYLSDPEPVKKAPEVWCLDTGIVILDPDGWRRTGDPAWDEAITRNDFLERASMSTCRRWPDALFDEEPG